MFTESPLGSEVDLNFSAAAANSSGPGIAVLRYRGKAATQ